MQLNSISKTYKPKKGVPVQALKDISLSFDDKGMVFVLGKSGSGKSTLLNLIGGLDFADSGEIVIDGKSTRDFKPSDYDAYRNTYIGFVFQEYNVINEFTVGENVSLALELQSQKDNKQRVEDILKEVELEGYADRKPNELSGGQKQRVAIARAIVKNPKIIMADEPTGALDSETGKAIFDTLKRLSKDRLVIVVSHDREFAETYGDRIIELADGKVISDEVKSTQNQNGTQAAANNLTDTQDSKQLKKSRLPYRRALAMGGKSMRTKPIRLAITIILCIISFAFFGLADTVASYNTRSATVKSILKNNYDALPIVSDVGAMNSDITYLKYKTGIDFDGVVSYGVSSQNLSFIYNRKVKGTNGDDVYYNASLTGYLPADKIIDGKKYKLIAGVMPKTSSEIVLSKYTYEQFALGGIRLTDGNEISYIEPEDIATAQDFVDNARFQVETPSGVKEWKVVGVVDTLADPEGRYDQLKPGAKRKIKSEEEYQMLCAECVQYFNYSYHSVGYVAQETYRDMFVECNNKNLLGVYASGSTTFKNGESGYANAFNNILDDSSLDSLDIVWADGTARTQLDDDEFVIGPNMLSALSKVADVSKSIDLNYTFFDGLVNLSYNVALSRIKYKGSVCLYIGACEYAQNAEEKSIDEFKSFINNIGVGQDDDTKSMLRALALMTCLDNIPNLPRDFEIDYYAQDYSPLQWRMLYAGYLMTTKFNFHGFIDDIDGGYVANVIQDGQSGSQIENILSEQLYGDLLIKLVCESAFTGVEIEFEYGEKTELENSVRIVGVYRDSNASKVDSYVINNYAYDCAQDALTPEYAFLIAQMTDDKRAVETLVDLHYGNGDERYNIINPVTLAMAQKSDTFAMLGNVFLYVGLGLAIFSTVLMSNYIAVSISSQKRQIGILRALGARSSDVFAIFYSESLIIALVNFALATISALIASLAINSQIASGFGLPITFMIFGIRQGALILAVSLGISLIASLVSIFSIAKRKPVDSILDK
ncbi:MAG: ABC transporter ATP-binding protein/permease [Muribaculaceae bacterium]|nr:ABC transporter ATP-binding protein/permease [Muribaculaceae bacterium]